MPISMNDMQAPMTGTLTVGVFDGEPHSDPSTRQYMLPPKPKKLVPVSFPLIDFRAQVFNTPDVDGNYTKDAAFMSRHGFTAVKHKSIITDPNAFTNKQTLQDVYYPEIEDLVKRVTGCRTVVVMTSACRSSATAPKAATDGKDVLAFKTRQEAEEEAKAKPVDSEPVCHRSSTTSQIIRIPHCDGTALGGRQGIRAEMIEMRECARDSGIIEFEDKLCAAAGVDARSSASKEVMFKSYNDHASGELGPRYACYSLWRPLAEVTKDPLALVPWSTAMSHRDFVVEDYLNRKQGIGSEGDWLKELAMLKVLPEALGNCNDEKIESDLEWFYIEKLQPDEVLFFKMFDTAALGEGSREEMACLHGSPDLGNAGYGKFRESIDVRVMAFW